MSGIVAGTPRAALTGMVTGTVIYAGLLVSGHSEPWSVHAGVVALIVNLTVCVTLSSTDETGTHRAVTSARDRASGRPSVSNPVNRRRPDREFKGLDTVSP